MPHRARDGLGAAQWFGVVILHAAAAILWAHARFEVLPGPAGAGAAATVFSEARAASHIAALSEGIGYRPVGSHANEVEAPAYVLAEVDAMRSAAAANVRAAARPATNCVLRPINCWVLCVGV
jgi:hypothetical protein